MAHREQYHNVLSGLLWTCARNSEFVLATRVSQKPSNDHYHNNSTSSKDNKQIHIFMAASIILVTI